ncbi:ester cyclase [Pelagibius sp. Alg239-R121]|uniref:ester cyclase n=1 Tax=Pelagibius sp. Alg239-R121 TaxID=2993448 RepID=UPI0024A7A382|nr:ester cyclase [Pelagibius sp. Alg239-R121]
MSSHLKIWETWCRRVWKEQDESAIDEMFITEGMARGLGPHLRLATDRFQEHERIGPAGFKVFHKCFLALMNDIDIQVTHSMEAGDWISALCVFHAKKNDTNEQVKMTGTVFLKIVDDKIVEAYNHWDFFSLFEQLGLIPEESFERCLAGESIV